MHKKIHSIESYEISEEEYQELCKQPAAQRVVEAVRQYNESISQARCVEDKEMNVLLMKEAEEEEAKVFLDGIFDLAEKGNIEQINA